MFILHPSGDLYTFNALIRADEENSGRYQDKSIKRPDFLDIPGAAGLQ